MNNTVYLAIIVAAVLSGSALFILIAKKLGLSVINVALSIVSAVKSALESSSMAGNKLSAVLDLIIQALVYVQAVCDDATPVETKVQKALGYIGSIAAELGISISQTEEDIIRNVLQIGFTIMGALGVSSRTSYKKLYSRMAKYAGTNREMKAYALESIRKRAVK